MPVLGASSADSSESDPADGWLLEFGQLWARGLVDPNKLWKLFDRSEMYLYRPDYFGAPLFGVSGRLVTPVFSTEIGLAEFMMSSAAVGPGSGADGYDWVRLTGEQFFQLPVRARYLTIDPGAVDEVTVDLAERADAPVRTQDGRPLLVNLELTPDGNIGNPNGEIIEMSQGDVF